MLRPLREGKGKQSGRDGMGETLGQGEEVVRMKSGGTKWFTTLAWDCIAYQGLIGTMCVAMSRYEVM